MTRPRRNYARRQPPPAPPGTAFDGVNFSQDQPGTVLENLAGVAVTFRRCNLARVAIDDAWVVEDCNTTQVALPDPPTERQRLQQERAGLVAQRRETDDRIADLDRRLRDLPAAPHNDDR